MTRIPDQKVGVKCRVKLPLESEQGGNRQRTHEAKHTQFFENRYNHHSALHRQCAKLGEGQSSKPVGVHLYLVR